MKDWNKIDWKKKEWRKKKGTASDRKIRGWMTKDWKKESKMEGTGKKRIRRKETERY